MISEADIADALGIHLETMDNVLPIVWENKDAGLPQPPYLTVEVVRISRTDPTLKGEGPIHRGYMQVTVVGVLGVWARVAERVADAISARFPKALNLDVTGGEITIIKPPFAGQGYRDGPDWRLPVRIDYEAS